MNIKKNTTPQTSQARTHSNPLLFHRFSNFLEELSSEKLKFNSQIDYISSETLKILSFHNTEKYTQYESILNRLQETYSSKYLTQSVLEIINKPQEKSNNFYSQREKSKKTSNSDFKNKTKALVKEISLLEIEIMRKKAEDKSLEEILRSKEKTHARKTVVCEEVYVNLTEKNAKNEEKLEEFEKKMEEIQRFSPEKEAKVKELQEKKDKLEEIQRISTEKKSEKLRDLQRILEEKIIENKEIEKKIEDSKGQSLKIALLNKNTLDYQLNRKEKEIEKVKIEIEQYELKFSEKEFYFKNEKNVQNLKIQAINKEIFDLKSQTERISEEKKREIIAFDTKLKRSMSLSLEVNNEGLEAFQAANERNWNLLKEIERKKEDFEKTKINLFEDLQNKSDFIENNQNKFEKMNRQYEALQKSGKELEETIQNTINSNKKKIESKKHKNKMLRNLLQNLPQENRKNSEKNKSLLLLKMKRNEKERILKEIELLKEIIQEKEMIKDDNEIVVNRLLLQNLENEVMEIKRMVKEKQEVLKKTQEINEKCKAQLAGLKC